MDAKESLCKALKALMELPEPLPRVLFIDFICGKESREIEDLGLDDLETYGIGDNNDDEFWNVLIDQAFEEGFIKNKPAKSDRIGITPAGKKYLKKPVEFNLKDEDDMEAALDPSIEGLVASALSEKCPTPIQSSKASPRTQNQIRLIQTIDRGIALDDYAESEGIEFNQVMDDLEALIATGKRISISYFVNEVLGEDSYEELAEFFSTHTNAKDPLAESIKEYGDVYEEEELRLAYIQYKLSK